MSRGVQLGALLLLPVASNAQQRDSARAGVLTRTDTAQRAPAQQPQRARVERDSLSPPVSPGRAFLLSLALPGLGQSTLRRPTAGAVYFAAEAVALAMLAKSSNDLRIAKARMGDVIVNRYKVDPLTGRPIFADTGFTPVVEDSIRSRYAQESEQLRSRVKARRLHLEDWIASLVFIHLFSGADAFVSSQLWDLPAQVELRALPRGIGLFASLRFR